MIISLIRGWTPVINPKEKPLRWWYHKILCEIGWARRKKICETMYYAHLHCLCDLGWNLYGELSQSNKIDMYIHKDIFSKEENELYKTE